MASIYSDYETDCSCPKFCSRLVETCSSGIISASRPRKLTLFLVPLFFAPIILSLPFLSLLVVPLGLTHLFPYFSLSYGLLIALLVTSLHTVVWLVNRRNRARTADVTNTTLHSRNSCCSALVKALFPDRGHFINIPIQGLLSGALCATALAALLPSRLLPVFGDIWPLFYLLGWLTVSLAQLSLTSAPPIEVAVPVEQSGYVIRVEFLTRPTHALFFLICAVILAQFNTVASIIFYSFLFVTPLLWLLGLLPPFNQFLSLLAERCNVLLFASTALSSRTFTLLLCLTWWILVSLLSLLPCDMAALALFSVGAYCLSLNVSGWTLVVLTWSSSFLPRRAAEKLGSSLPFKPYFVGRKGFHFSLKSMISVIVRFFLFPLTCLFLLSLSHLGASFSLNSTLCRHRLFNAYNSTHTNNASEIFQLFQIPTFFYLFIGYGLISLLLLTSCYFFSAAQSRTILFGFLNNPFYPGDVYNELDFNSQIQKNCFFRGSWICVTILRDIVSRMLCLSFLGFFLYSSRTSSTPPLLFSISVARSLHLAWRDPLSLTSEITLAVFIDLMLLRNFSWMSLSVGVHILIIGASIQYTGLFLSKLRVILSYLGWFMVTEQSSHITYLPEERGPLTCFSLLLFPFTLLILLPISSLFSLTLLPLFTLPIFFPAYPHSASYWPPLRQHSSWGGRDAVFYEQTCPEVCRVFRQLVKRGVILSPSPGQVYLLRFEDRIIFLTVNEVGYEYSCVSYKGLELAATSCHEIEATQIDDILEREQPTRSFKNILNKYFLYLITPVAHSVIRTYSEGKSSLKSIASSVATSQKCREYFPKCLAWLIMREMIERERNINKTYSKKKIQTEGTGMNPPNEETGTTTVVASPLNTSTDKNESVNVSTFQQVWSAGFSNERQTPDSLFTEELESIPDVDTFEEQNLNTNNAESANFNQLSHPFNSQDRQPTNSLNNATRSLFPSSWTNLPPLPIGASEPDNGVELALIQRFCSHWKTREEVKLEKTDWDQVIHLVHRITNCISSLVHPRSDDQSFNKLTRMQICENYIGNFQWSKELSWLSNIPDLLNLSTIAYRYALKLTLDDLVLMLDDADAGLMDSLLELDTDWYLGCVSDTSWKQRVLDQTPHIFLLSHNSSGTKHYSHLLNLRHQLVHVARLQPESLHAIWSSQLLELLYLKHDDEERYSVQVEEHFLRNISTQAGDSPVGYPVFSSAPLYI